MTGQLHTGPSIDPSRLDRSARTVFQYTGVVCLAAAAARCMHCHAPMTPRRVAARVVYACRSQGHVLAQSLVDDVVWRYYLTDSPSALARYATDPVRRRALIHRAYSGFSLHPGAPAGRVLVAAFPRLYT